MALTEAQINTAITNIYTQLQAMITTPKPSYKVGDISYDWNKYQEMLLKQLEYYDKLLNSLSAEEETLYVDYI